MAGNSLSRQLEQVNEELWLLLSLFDKRPPIPTSDVPVRVLKKGSVTEFDQKVVDTFLKSFKRGEMEVPTLVL